MGRVSRPELKIKKMIADLERDAKELLAIRIENSIKHKAVIKQIWLLQRVLEDDKDETPEPEPEQEESCTS